MTANHTARYQLEQLGFKERWPEDHIGCWCGYRPAKCRCGDLLELAKRDRETDRAARLRR